ncbi:rod shape-determining protein MreD [Thiorhodovibrio frisius]|uniref:Rod shape-determining protein MreD n=1 Tax=Thiorhodovibrio frisius TaxID=631362 RepID=H8Z6U2_9GAMM|nr:rod shape-determining protein MreD [Thiorhodovibrio frisius]EIC19727.1 rod shape-determining protein MreD [Thiorhodovibrio frisius]WPL20305.1 Rod shape-determining protein MreD [Thiorhodovibrio frisius]
MLAGRTPWVIVLTLGAAGFLSIVHMPDWAVDYRPQWTAMTVIFWITTLPDRVGVFWAFFAGLMMDVVTGSLLGQHALSFSVMGYLTVELEQRIALFRAWQQAVSIWLILTVERLLSLWVLSATNQPTPSLSYWTTTFVSMLLWPWFAAALRGLVRRLDLA